MSNVLIGIIGVILFIGLALAGALILGDDFKSSSNAAKAAVVVSNIKQISDGMAMMRIKGGANLSNCQALSVLQPRFIKSVPVSPMSIARSNPTDLTYQYQMNNDVIPESTTMSTCGAVPVYVILHLGTDSVAQSVCQTIAETYGNAMASTSDPNPTSQAGCQYYSNSYYIAWSKI